MNRFLKSAFVPCCYWLLALTAVAPDADAQQYGRRQQRCRTGDPGRRNHRLHSAGRRRLSSRDRSGHRVLIDSYGNVVATEMRATQLLSARRPARARSNLTSQQRPLLFRQRSRYGDTSLRGARRRHRRHPARCRDPARAARRSALSGQRAARAIRTNDDDYASIDPDQQMPDIEAQPAPPQSPSSR